MDKLIEWIGNNLIVTILGAVTLIQITPIKINPWTWIGKLIRKGIGVTDISEKFDRLEKDFIDEKVNRKRWDILNFGNSCRQGRRHTKEEWDHCLEELRWYEAYCVKHEITNGVMHEMADYIRKTYQELMNSNEFL